MDVTKPCEFIGFGAIGVTKPYEFIRFGAMDVTRPGLGDGGVVCRFVFMQATHTIRQLTSTTSWTPSLFKVLGGMGTGNDAL